MSEDRFISLNDKIDALIDLCVELKQENQSLKANADSLNSERQQLLQKNQDAKSRLETILTRLKALEPS